MEVGDSVYYYLPVKKVGITPKLQSYWTGPWVVTKEIGGPIYEISLGRKTRVVHCDALKKVSETEADRVEMVCLAQDRPSQTGGAGPSGPWTRDPGYGTPHRPAGRISKRLTSEGSEESDWCLDPGRAEPDGPAPEGAGSGDESANRLEKKTGERIGPGCDGQ